MSPALHGLRSAQGGAALISVVFLIVVVATLGAFAIRTGMDQQQIANLSMFEIRTEAAAYSGVEFASQLLRSGQPCPATVPFPPIEELSNIAVSLQCSAALTTSSGATVFRIVATARHSSFGNPDFVQRISERRVGNLGSGSW